MRSKIEIAISTLAVTLVAIMGWQRPPKLLETGDEWMSMSRSQRSAAVAGYIDGFLMARLRACETTQDLFEVGLPHSLGDGTHPTDMPFSRCLARVPVYSKYKTDGNAFTFEAYTSSITQFYSKHPEYRRVPYSLLMESLADDKYGQPEALVNAAKSIR